MDNSKENTFTIQFRMTKKCNAHCNYCIAPYLSDSSMSVDEFKKSIDYLIEEYLPELGVSPGAFIDLEYVGGEVSILPIEQFKECIDYARKEFESNGYQFSDGCQSNFVGNTKKIKALWDTFKGNMTTSVDHYTNQRLLNGSSDKYRERFFMNVGEVCQSIPAGSVYVLDSNGLKYAKQEALKALESGYSIGMYPAYEANNPINKPSLEKMANTLCDILDLWVFNYDTPIEPLNHILRSLVLNESSTYSCSDACPFSTGCSGKSACIEPNGDIYTCMDMAETKKHKLGNSLDRTRNAKLIRRLSRRGAILNNTCDQCKYRNYCHGGCLNHAMLEGNEFSPSYFCSVWKAIFEHCENIIETNGIDAVRDWVLNHKKPKFYC